MTEPALRPIRRVLPDLGGLDISPVILILGLLFLRNVVIFGWLGVPKSKVAVAAGQKSRLKSVAVEGDTNALLAKVEALLAPGRKADKR
ncbi:MAG: YggT family protein [Rhodomicrobium sp.]|nr:YggT family protein [Rhodomicrobium sp.]